MNQKPEPTLHKITCRHCGDSYVNHHFTYFNNLLSGTLDPIVYRVSRQTPKFLKDFVDFFLKVIFELFLLCRLARLGDDIDQVISFRSRVVWEEARRRGIKMRQLFIYGKPTEIFKIYMNNKSYYINSLPIPPDRIDTKDNWDDKLFLKKKFIEHGIPVPKFKELEDNDDKSLTAIFDHFQKPIIAKPRIGSRARHTVTNIHTFPQFKDAVEIVNQISPHVLVEEHLEGEVSRATVVDGVLAGFEWASSPAVIGDGVRTIAELIEEKNKNRGERIGLIQVSEELHDHISRLGYKIDDVLPDKLYLTLSLRRGRLWGGSTNEMIEELHPSFVAVLEKAGRLTGLAVAGFDCIVPNPLQDESTQRWGIIECNTLPFIDLHYYTLIGKPRNIAGMIWDLWGK